MERYKINAHDAFRLLVTASQTTNIRLRDVAAYLTQTGELRAAGEVVGGQDTGRRRRGP